MTTERPIDRFLSKKYKVKNISFEVIDILFVLVLWVFAFIIRVKLIPAGSADYFAFLEPWMEDIKKLGGFKSMGTAVSNYSTSYMYLMCLVETVTNDWLTGLKMVSFVFDYAAAVAVFLIVFHMTKSTKKSITGMAILLLCPTVIINDAIWCQCDIIYVCFVLYALYFLMKKNSRLCMIMIGIAFSFKLQTVFILPFIVILWLRNYVIKLIDFIWIPFIYIISIIPAWIMGRSLTELLLIYFNQGNEYPWCTLNYPNVYAFFDESMPNGHMPMLLSGAGVFMALLALGYIAYYIYAKKVDFSKSYEILILTVMFTVAIAIYILPHMHERYGFLIDIMAIFYAIKRPRRILLMFAFYLVSIIISMPFLIEVHIFSIQTMTVVVTLLFAILGVDLYKEIEATSIK